MAGTRCGWRAAASGQAAWSGVCSGLEGDSVQEAVAQHMAMSPQHAAGEAPLAFTCDWCKRRVDRSLRVSGDETAVGGVVPVSAGEHCCAGMWWRRDMDEIELCCLCYHVPDAGALLTCPWNPLSCGATSLVAGHATLSLT